MLLGETPVGETPIRYSTRFTPGTGNLMIHHRVFEQIGLFDDAFRLRNEDTELFLRIQKAGITGWYNPAARVEHVIPLSRLRWRYMARLSQQSSQMIPQLDWQDRGGPWVLPLLWAARWIRAGGNMLKDLPSAGLRRDPGASLEICSRLGTMIGYSQAALKLYRKPGRPRSESKVASFAAW
jgi:GT2 family glycosyltransferase